MSVSNSLNKFASLGQIAPTRSTRSRPRSSTVGDTPRPRSATKKGLSHGAHDTPLMVRTMHHRIRMARSAPCLPRSGGRQRRQVQLANGLKSQSIGQNVKPKSRLPATRTTTKHASHCSGQGKSADHSFKAPDSDKPTVNPIPPALHTHAKAILAPLRVQKLAQKWASKVIKSSGKPLPAAQKPSKPAAPGHTGVNTTEHVYSFKEPEDKPPPE